MKTINKIIKNPNITNQFLIQRHNETDVFTIEKNNWGLWDIFIMDKDGNTDMVSVKKSKKLSIEFVEQF
tara:strand:+ start:1763 stop:1969 length:207 start_codon:yes stop_codon:yes gene_type:complete